MRNYQRDCFTGCQKTEKLKVLKRMSSRHAIIDLRAAVFKDDIEKVRKILLTNPELLHDHSDKELSSPLWTALSGGNVEIVELLVGEYGADPNEKIAHSTFQGYTFFHLAARSNNCSPSYIKMAEVLVRYGADVNATLPDRELSSPLQMALDSENLTFAEFLLKNGADLERAGRYGEPPAAYSFNCKNDSVGREMLLLLLKYGMDTRFANKNDENLLHVFLRSLEDDYDDKVYQIAEILLNSGVPMDDIDNEGFSPFHRAVDLGDIELVTLFIDKGDDVDMMTVSDDEDCRITTASMSRSPLSLAVYTESKDLVELLISNGANVNGEDDGGWTPMHSACFCNFDEIINLLIRKGGSVSALCDLGNIPIFLLDPDLRNYEQCVITLLKEYSRMSYENAIFERDIDVLLENSNHKIREHFEKCYVELATLNKTIFYSPYSYYSILKMEKNIKKLAKLTKNDEFVVEFEKNLSSFHYYRDDLRGVFNEAVQVRNDSVIIFNQLNSLFGYFFPDLIIRKFAENLMVKDLPLD